MEKGEPSYTVGGNASWCSHFGKPWRFLKKLKIELLYDPAIARLSIYPKDTDVVKRRAICTPMFIAAMATVTKLERTKMPFNGWMKKMWSIYTMEYYASIRKD